jgi:hypothetical protein
MYFASLFGLTLNYIECHVPYFSYGLSHVKESCINLVFIRVCKCRRIGLHIQLLISCTFHYFMWPQWLSLHKIQTWVSLFNWKSSFYSPNHSLYPFYTQTKSWLAYYLERSKVVQCTPYLILSFLFIFPQVEFEDQILHDNSFFHAMSIVW